MQSNQSSNAGIGFILIAMALYGLYLQVNGKLTTVLSTLLGYKSASVPTVKTS
jgi:hypothetical protein